jgi:hypothetical protein
MQTHAAGARGGRHERVRHLRRPGRVANKKPTQKKPTQKTHLKKPTKNGFFGFFKIYFLWELNRQTYALRPFALPSQTPLSSTEAKASPLPHFFGPALRAPSPPFGVRYQKRNEEEGMRSPAGQEE